MPFLDSGLFLLAEATTRSMGMPSYAYWALAAGVLGLLFAAILARRVMSKDRGNERMVTIQKHIQEGAMAFLKREYRTLSIFVIGVAVVLVFALQGTCRASAGRRRSRSSPAPCSPPSAASAA